MGGLHEGYAEGVDKDESDPAGVAELLAQLDAENEPEGDAEPLALYESGDCTGETEPLAEPLAHGDAGSSVAEPLVLRQELDDSLGEEGGDAELLASAELASETP